MTGHKARRRKRETHRERKIWGEREQHSGARRWRGLILTVGLNQQHLQTLNTAEFLTGVNQIQQQKDQTSIELLGGVCIPRLIWLYSICSNNTKSTSERMTEYQQLRECQLYELRKLTRNVSFSDLKIECNLRRHFIERKTFLLCVRSKTLCTECSRMFKFKIFHNTLQIC